VIVRNLLRRLRARIRYRHFDADLTEEIDFHRAMKQREWERAGLTATEARRLSHRDMGNVTLARESSRAVWVASWFDGLRQDVRYAARTLRGQPGFTITACAALMLGIGLNTSLFTVFNAVALRPWNVADPGSVVTAHYVHGSGSGRGTSGFGVAEYRDLRDHVRTFSGLVAWRQSGARLGDEAIGSYTAFSYVSGNYFDVLGVRMLHGRGFLPDEDRVGNAQAVAVIAHRLWERHFARDRAIIGRVFRVDDVPFTIIGVAPPGFDGTDIPDTQSFWVPLVSLQLLSADRAYALSLLTNPSHCCSRLAGRLAPGVTRDQARAELETLSLHYRTQWKDQRWNGQSVRDVPLVLSGTALLAQPGVKPQLIPALALMFAAVMLVLLLACANVGNLLLARALARQREFAIRLSLGASRRRVVRQLLTEGLILSCGAGILALFVAYRLPVLVVRAAVNSNEIPSGIAPDARVLAFTLAIAGLACLLFALAPALKVTQAAMETLTARRDVTRIGRRLRSALLAAQLALSVILLASSSLLVRGIQHAQTRDPGFRIDGVFAVSLVFPAHAYDENRVRAFVSALYTALKTDGSIGSVALTNTVPLGNARQMTSFRLPGEDATQSRMIQVESVSPEYFALLGIPVVTGRHLDATDRPGAAITINEAMARQYWPDASPIGQTVLFDDRPREIVGVVRNAHTTALDTVDPVYYEVTTGGPLRLLLRSETADPTPRVQAVVTALDDRVTISARPLATNRDRSLTRSRVMALTAGAVGVLALVLASVGVFGVFSYVVHERTREIGIRMAIGARAAQVIGLVLQSTAWATLGGVAAGVVASFVVSRFLTTQLYGLSRLDPTAYAIVAAVLTAAATLATWLPVRRATQVDPATALRVE
jgi:putative ABC transport system permease protein